MMRSFVVFEIFLLLLIVCALFASIKRTKKKRQPRRRPRAIPKEPTPVEAMLLGLVKLNIQVRTDLPRDIIEKCEPVIDTLRELIPVINGDYPGSELTLMVNATARSYLPDLINEYAGLNEEARASRRQGLVEALELLSVRLTEIAWIVHEKKESEFDAQAKFLKVKFFNNMDAH